MAGMTPTRRSFFSVVAGVLGALPFFRSSAKEPEPEFEHFQYNQFPRENYRFGGPGVCGGDKQGAVAPSAAQSYGPLAPFPCYWEKSDNIPIDLLEVWECRTSGPANFGGNFVAILMYRRAHDRMWRVNHYSTDLTSSISYDCGVETLIDMQLSAMLFHKEHVLGTLAQQAKYGATGLITA
jgi:hypothetical protein